MLVPAIWDDDFGVALPASMESYSFAELTRLYFGEALSVDQVLARLEDAELEALGGAEDGELNALARSDAHASIWVGSVGYEKHRDNRDFARHLLAAGVERVIDVRQLPISRRRGYAKRALSEAMADAGIDYLHMKRLGNPKPFRDLYKAGRVEEGRRLYEKYLREEQLDALHALVPLLRDKRSVLLCVEHDAECCHRTVILEALRDELGLELEVRQLA